MPLQSIALKRCASCERWGGPRTPATADAVCIASETAVGLCRGGPWDGEPRRARSACGRWTLWLALVAGDQRTG